MLRHMPNLAEIKSCMTWVTEMAKSTSKDLTWLSCSPDPCPAPMTRDTLTDTCLSHLGHVSTSPPEPKTWNEIWASEMSPLIRPWHIESNNIALTRLQRKLNMTHLVKRKGEGRVGHQTIARKALLTLRLLTQHTFMASSLQNVFHSGTGITRLFGVSKVNPLLNCLLGYFVTKSTIHISEYGIEFARVSLVFPVIEIFLRSCLQFFCMRNILEFHKCALTHSFKYRHWYI